MYISIGTSPLELPDGGFTYFHDDVPRIPRARYFDYRKHSIDLLSNLTYPKICDIVDAFDALFVVTGGTLTESTGLEYMAERLDHIPDAGKMVDLIPEPDKKDPPGYHWAYGKVQRLMRSPVLRQVLTGKPNFTLDPDRPTFVRLNRAEIGEWDALALGLFFIAQAKNTVVIPDFGFYGRDTHTQLIREQRLTAGVHFLDQLPVKLKRTVLMIPEKVLCGALYEDAALIARHKGMIPDTIEYIDFVATAMRPSERVEPVPLWIPPPLTVQRSAGGTGQHAPKRKRRKWIRT
jgi:hypothetical protein